MAYQAKDFAMDLRACVMPAKYIWVSSGSGVCAPQENTVCGVRGCFAPPFAAPDLALSLRIFADGHEIADSGSRGKGDCGLLYSGGSWQPDSIVRRGFYHFKTPRGLLSFTAESELVPLLDEAGFVLTLRLRQRGKEPIRLSVEPTLSAGRPALHALCDWGFMPPEGGKSEASPIAPDIWEGGGVRAELMREGCEERLIAPGELFTCRFAVLLTHAEQSAPQESLAARAQRTKDAWQRRFDLASNRLPELHSNIPGLAEYYRRSLISGLICLWENKAFSLTPFPTTSGMDGGSVCCYPWDSAGYSAQMLVALLGSEGTQALIRAMLRCGIDAHISLAPDGTGLGWCGYAYSFWSILNLYWTLATFTGEGRELYPEIVKLFEAEEARLPERNHLKDYGEQHNLLEMRACGYEHFVPSPNAERAWCYDRLCDLAEHFGFDFNPGWRGKAESIRSAIREQLWDEDAGWFRCLHPDGHAEMVYSIQMFDALRMGACTDGMKRKMLRQVTDGRFLGAYGVSSVSAADEMHYELNDPDWSGGGCYSGEGPELAEMLWQQGESDLAWDVLRRHFWLGTMAPYIPQEHFCDKPGAPANKRANIISGSAGLEAVLYGLAGFAHTLDGKLAVSPSPAPGGWYEITGYRFENRRVDLRVNGQEMILALDGAPVYRGKPQRVVLEKE